MIHSLLILSSHVREVEIEKEHIKNMKSLNSSKICDCY